MLRREMLKAGAACLSLPVLPVVATARPDWEIIVGGNRSGKTTIGAEKAKKVISRFGTVLFLGYDMIHCRCIGRDFFDIPEKKMDYSWKGDVLNNDPFVASFCGVSFSTSESIDEHNANRLPSADMLWIDEGVFNVDVINVLAKSGKYGKVVWTTWPDAQVQKTALYKLGTTRHIPMNEAVRELFEREGWALTPEEYKKRVLGQFV